MFADIIYDPDIGFRQARLKLVGWKTAGWNGDYYAPGFMFDAAQVTYWIKNTDYSINHWRYEITSEYRSPKFDEEKLSIEEI